MKRKDSERMGRTETERKKGKDRDTERMHDINKIACNASNYKDRKKREKGKDRERERERERKLRTGKENER